MTVADIVPFAAHQHPRVRERAVRLLEDFGDRAQEAHDVLLSLAEDPDVRVRWQLALSAGEFDADTGSALLARLASRSNLNRDVQQAMLTSVGDRAPAMAADLIAEQSAESASLQNWLSRLSELAAVGSDAGVTEIIEALAETTPASQQSASVGSALRGLAGGLRTRGGTLSRIAGGGALSESGRQWLSGQFAAARESAADSDAAITVRTSAIALLSQDTVDALADVASELLSPTQPKEIQLAAVRAFSDQPGDDAADLLLEAWAGAGPAVRIEIVDALLRSKGRTARLIAAVEAEDVLPIEIAPDKRQTLVNHPDGDLRKRAAKVLEAGTADRQAVIDEYAPALGDDAQAERGKAVFQKICANCHRIGNEGHSVGPELASVANKSPDDLLVALLDPGREAQPVYANYQALLDDGRIVTGLIAAETASTITFRRAEGKEDVVLREQIEQLRSAGVSLMPVGLEKDLSPQQIADVIAFIKSIPPKK